MFNGTNRLGTAEVEVLCPSSLVHCNIKNRWKVRIMTTVNNTIASNLSKWSHIWSCIEHHRTEPMTIYPGSPSRVTITVGCGHTHTKKKQVMGLRIMTDRKEPWRERKIWHTKVTDYIAEPHNPWTCQRRLLRDHWFIALRVTQHQSQLEAWDDNHEKQCDAATPGVGEVCTVRQEWASPKFYIKINYSIRMYQLHTIQPNKSTVLGLIQ